jgi:hypothetical protein
LAEGRHAVRQGYCIRHIVASDAIPGTDPPIYEQTFFAVRSGVARILVGYLFHQHYRRTGSVPGAVVGDIRFQARLVKSPQLNSLFLGIVGNAAARGKRFLGGENEHKYHSFVGWDGKQRGKAA